MAKYFILTKMLEKYGYKIIHATIEGDSCTFEVFKDFHVLEVTYPFRHNLNPKGLRHTLILDLNKGVRVDDDILDYCFQCLAD